jgi:hypothetical protein
VVTSSSMVSSSVSSVFLVVRWSMLEKISRVTTLCGQPSLEAKPFRMVGCRRHSAFIPTLLVVDKP